MEKKTSLIDPIVEKIRDELNNNKGELPRLAKLLQNKQPRLNYRWLLAFASGQIADPSFSRVNLLGSHLGVRLTQSKGKHFNREEETA